MSDSKEGMDVKDILDPKKSESLDLEWTDDDESRIRMKMVSQSIPISYVYYKLIF